MVSLTEFSERFEAGSVLHLEDGRALTIESSRDNRGRILVKFVGVADRDAADALRGKLLVVSAAELPPLPEGRWWPHDIESCEVLTEDGRSLGTVTEVILGEANDVWVARSGTGETLIPVLKDLLVSVDTAAKRIVIREVPGLLSEE